MLGPEGRVFATDVSEVAIDVARLNVQRYGMQDKVEIRHGFWFEPLEDLKGKLMGVISNPPYIPTDDLPGLQPEVGWHEPKLALDGGKDGLDHLLHLCEGLSSVLKHGGFFVFEVTYLLMHCI
uniref:Ribosomal RNA large subunit methyltransferase K/L-like methyltransferase domain-containing protein n=1 Tax=Oryza brachyantha TaxID=4533 RepID=J3NEX2_ORYBR